MVNLLNESNELRYERKFIINEMSKKEVESLIKLHPAMFNEIYYERYVNSIYFDSPDMSNYFANVDGIYHRVKTRIRWYGSLIGEVQNPILEFKIKHGNVGTKRTYVLESFTYTKDKNVKVLLQELFQKSNLPLDLKFKLLTLSPVVLTRYKRKYYLSSDQRFRLTLDSEMLAFNIFSNKNTL
ncbi:MAG: VTC domain-containing protein, partial [Calditrichaeota bacterium]